MSDTERRIKILVMLFGMFGKAGDDGRIGMYLELTKDLPADILDKAVKKTIAENKFLPAVAEIIEAAREIIAEADPAARVKTWAEAWGEIEKAMRATQWGKLPTFSTPEIAEAISSFGWQALHQALASDMPTIRAQIRRIYEDVCARREAQARNRALLGLPDGNIFGIPERRAQIEGERAAGMPLSQAENGVQQPRIAGASDLSRGRKKSPRTRICASGGLTHVAEIATSVLDEREDTESRRK